MESGDKRAIANIEHTANAVRAKMHKSPLMIFIAACAAIVALDVIVTYFG